MGLIPTKTPPSAVAGTIGDRVFIDANTDGQFAAGEGLEGARVTAYDNSGNIVASMMTNSSGYYQVSVPTGCYDMKVELPNSIDSSTVNYEPTLSNVCVTAGSTNDNADFIITEMTKPTDPTIQCTHQHTNVHDRYTAAGTGEVTRDYIVYYLKTTLSSSDKSFLANHEEYETYTTSGSLIGTSKAGFTQAANVPVSRLVTRLDINTGDRTLHTPQLVRGGYKNGPGQWYTYPTTLVIDKLRSVGDVYVLYPDGSKSKPISCTVLPPIIHNNYAVTPVAFDMNNDGAIGVSGDSTSPLKMSSNTNLVAKFDFGNGIMQETEWLSGDGDALLVDNRDGMAAQDMNGSRLFGDDLGRFVSGYDKLDILDIDENGTLTDKELVGLALWYDNGDAAVQEGELRSVQDVGVASIDTKYKIQNTKYKMIEGLMRSSASLSNGEEVLTEDVWFSIGKSLSPAANVSDIGLDLSKSRL